MVEQDWCHKGLTDLVEVDSMHERKQRMADLSDAVIALPGGCGTLEELLEVITWKQLGLYLNPIVILNINGYFDPLLEMFRRAVDEHFMRPQHAALWAVASTPAEAVGLIFRNRFGMRIFVNWLWYESGMARQFKRINLWRADARF